MSSRRLRVALVSYDFGEYCILLAAGLQTCADVLLLIPGDLAAPFLSALDGRVMYRPFQKPRLRQPTRQFALALRLLQQVRRFDPDVVHVQQGHLWFNAVLPLLRRYPLVLTVHDPRHHLGDRGGQHTPQAVLDFGFRMATRLIVHATPLAST